MVRGGGGQDQASQLVLVWSTAKGNDAERHFARGEKRCRRNLRWSQRLYSSHTASTGCGDKERPKKIKGGVSIHTQVDCFQILRIIHHDNWMTTDTDRPGTFHTKTNWKKMTNNRITDGTKYAFKSSRSQHEKRRSSHQTHDANEQALRTNTAKQNSKTKTKTKTKSSATGSVKPIADHVACASRFVRVM